MCLIITLFFILTLLAEVKLLGVFAAIEGSGRMWLLIFASAWVGMYLMREQKVLAVKQQERMVRGELKDPLDLMRPLVMTLSGLLLIVPGLITDAIGLLLLVPPIARWTLKKVAKGGIRAASQGGFGAQGAQGFGGFTGFGGAQGGFGGFTGFGGFGGFGDAKGDSTGESPKAPPQPSTGRGERIKGRVTPSQPVTPREGIHRTQRPQPDAWDVQKTERARRRVDPEQVIIDVDAEVIED